MGNGTFWVFRFSFSQRLSPNVTVVTYMSKAIHNFETHQPGIKIVSIKTDVNDATLVHVTDVVIEVLKHYTCDDKMESLRRCFINILNEYTLHPYNTRLIKLNTFPLLIIPEAAEMNSKPTIAERRRIKKGTTPIDLSQIKVTSDKNVVKKDEGDARFSRYTVPMNPRSTAKDEAKP